MKESYHITITALSVCSIKRCLLRTMLGFKIAQITQLIQIQKTMTQIMLIFREIKKFGIQEKMKIKNEKNTIFSKIILNYFEN